MLMMKLCQICKSRLEPTAFDLLLCLAFVLATVSWSRKIQIIISIIAETVQLSKPHDYSLQVLPFDELSLSSPAFFTPQRDEASAIGTKQKVQWKTPLILSLVIAPSQQISPPKNCIIHGFHYASLLWLQPDLFFRVVANKQIPMFALSESLALCFGTANWRFGSAQSFGWKAVETATKSDRKLDSTAKMMS